MKPVVSQDGSDSIAKSKVRPVPSAEDKLPYLKQGRKAGAAVNGEEKPPKRRKGK